MQLFATLLSALLLVSAASAAPTENEYSSLAVRDDSDIAVPRSLNGLSPEQLQAALDIVAPLATSDDTSDKNLVARKDNPNQWGPRNVGKFQLTLTRPYVGIAGPKFTTSVKHISLKVNKKGNDGKYSVPIVNLHIVKYGGEQGKACLYVYDSVKGKKIFDKCFDTLRKAIEQYVKVLTELLRKILEDVDWWGTAVVVAGVVVAVTASIGSLGLAVVAA